MKISYIGLGIAALLSIGLTACSSSSGQGPNPPSPQAKYIQTELLSRPAVKEALEMFQSHDTTNRSEPYNDATLQNAIAATTQSFGRDQATATALQSVLYPNEMMVDLSQPNSAGASYLGVETGGFTGSKFGGRALSDDVITLDLGAIFGNTLFKLGVVNHDDGKELPCLTTDNVSYDKQNTNTFPYVQAPI